MTKRILIYGSECTGKTTLAEQLASHFKTIYVPDCKRRYIAKNKYCFVFDNLNDIANDYQKEIIKADKKAKKLYFVDSDAITIAIYSNEYFNNVNPNVLKIADNEKFDLILFTNTDIPWVKDSSRDFGDRQKEFHKVFKDELKKRNLNYILIRGNMEKRLKTAIEAVNKIVKETD